MRIARQRHGFRTLVLVSTIVICGLATTQSMLHAQAANSPSTINNSVSANHNIQVTSVLKIPLSSGVNTIYRITYKYSFDRTSPVFIRGLGLVPPTGAWTYLTPDSHLDFIDPSSGSVLASIVLAETIRTAGADSLDQPDLSKESLTKREGSWSPRQTFAAATKTLIQRIFPAGFISMEDSQQIRYVTPFHALPVDMRNLVAEIALVITQPAEAARDPLEYQIHYILRDKPRLADEYRYGKDLDGQSVKKAEDFLQQFSNDLTAAKVAR